MADELGRMIYNLLREIKADLAEIKDEICVRNNGGQIDWKARDLGDDREPIDP